MCATVRESNPELADEISRQMAAQVQTAWWDSADDTEESFPMDIVLIESVLVKSSDSPSQSLPDKQRSLCAKSSE